MPKPEQLRGHALRNANLRRRALDRAREAPPLAQAVVRIRAGCLGLTRIEFARRSQLSRGTLRDLELGVHTPIRDTMRRVLAFCESQGVAPERIEELRRLYVGSEWPAADQPQPAAGLSPLIDRLQLRVGSSRELARRCGISTATLWEYRRGNFPLPMAMLRRLCQAAGEDPGPAEVLWLAVERQRLERRGYPPALAAFYALLGRAGLKDRDLAGRLRNAAMRRLRYLELPPWSSVEPVLEPLGLDPAELHRLRTLWARDEQRQERARADGFGPCFQRLRQARGISRRALAEVFGLAGKKPARMIAAIEEDGLYSARAFPAGLIAIVAGDTPDEPQLIQLWRQRRARQHRRHRPETRLELRLARDLYGFSPHDLEPILGYTPLQYQRIERGIEPLSGPGQQRIRDAIVQAGRRRVNDLMYRWAIQQDRSKAWRHARSVPALIDGLARREGGFAPLARLLKRSSTVRLSKMQLRAIARGGLVPPWFVVGQIAQACGAPELHAIRQSWTEQYRRSLERAVISPLGVELRRLIAMAAPSVRAFSTRVGVHYSVLSRDLRKLDRDEPLPWAHVERILAALELAPRSLLGQEIHDLWCTAGLRAQRKATVPHRLEA